MISIVIVTYNSEDYIVDCIDSIYQKTASMDYEVIVVDNHSKDRTVEMIKEKFPSVRIVRNYENKNFACAVNQGMNLSGGKYILLLNPDTAFRNKALDILHSFIETNEDAGAVAPRLINPDGSIQHSIRAFPTPFNLWTEVTGLSVITKRPSGWKLPEFDYDETQEAPQPGASALLIRRDLFNEIGGLNKKYPLYMNDVELCYEIWEKGWKIYYLKDAEVYHKKGASTQIDKPRSVLYWHFGLIRYLREHFPKHPALPFYVIILLFGMFYRVVFYKIKSIGKRV